MEIFRIRVKRKQMKDVEEFLERIYVRAIVFETEPFSLEFMPTYSEDEAGIYEEDKAKKYCDGLNENKRYSEIGFEFELESVGTM